MDPIKAFEQEVKSNIANLKKDRELAKLSTHWSIQSSRHKYDYNFTWMGRPIIQLPQDVMAMQEIIWSVQPDLIIETGVAHGGSAVFYASMLQLIGGKSLVVAVDIDIRTHNRAEIEAHPMSKRIKMIEGSSTDPNVVAQIAEIAADRSRVLVALDSNHTHEHVARELELYSSFVSRDSYLVVFDTCIEDFPEDFFPDRPWGPGNNPKTAVHEFLATNKNFRIDDDLDAKLQISVSPSGYLKRIK